MFRSALLCGLFFFSFAIHGQNLLKELLTKSPGPLSNPHETYDSITGCASCHANKLGGDVVNSKCLDCHQDIKERLEAERGYHWDKPKCDSCHAEHKGRNHDIFGPKDWKENFNHDETGYELLGQHQKVDCRECHTTYRVHYQTKQKTKTESYLGAPTSCFECHENIYEHKFSMKKWLTCTECHSAQITNWKALSKPMRFNHDETRYKLEGLHKKVTCNECHQPDPKSKRVTTFAPLAFSKCTDCHTDPHKGKFGPQCTDCHSVYRPWDQILTEGKAVQKGFDHNKTKFPLVGYHEAVQCESCHYDPAAKFKVEKTKFDECSDCHGFPHQDQFKGQSCESCHTTDRLYTESTFTIERHNKTDFKLDGKHLVLDCNKCHFTGKFENIPHQECSDCHRNPHLEREIDKSCNFCHNTTSFANIQFDHNRNTNFQLTGKHREVACVSCHINQVFKNMPANNQNPNCQACHADPHGDAISNECQTCHRTERFNIVDQFDHGKISGWALEGRHAEISCQKCHSNHLKADYKVIAAPGAKATDCVTCHADIHKGEMGQNCASCHNFQTFSVSGGEKVHNLGFFRLEGFHDQLACQDCHRSDTNLQGTGIFCADCHEKQDIHLGQMGPHCNDCHNQNAWMPHNFKHNTTAFRLTGAHRYVECSSCHVNRIYQGLPSDCYFCHGDTQPSISPHTPGIPMECSDCHSPIDWGIRRGSGL